MKQWWRRRTLRFRLATWYALGGTLLLSAFSATLYIYVARWVARPLDQQLRSDLEHVSTRLQITTDGRVHWAGAELAQADASQLPNEWFELWDAEGALIVRQWQLDETRLERLPAAPAPNRETLSIFNVASDLRLRVLSTPFTGPRGESWMLRVMRLHEPVADTLRALLLIIVSTLPVVIALLVLGGYALTRQWLKPLNDMVAEARRITAEDLSRRLPVANPNDELGQLASVFNITLERLEISFTALDRFVADASHELRTPLTTLRSVGDVGLSRSRTPAEYREIIASMLEEADRLQLLIQRLLELASAGAQTVQWQAVELAECVARCVSELGVLAEAKNQRIVIESAACAVETDHVIFRQALQNLVDNAIKYGPPGSQIRIGIQVGATRCAVSVADEGPGIAE
ncbi:MAG TPA: histidine kinase dimerization/phospho-acceptor domain-containing protein, partial [Opitutus sp.]|nr:histidine kinase dimerization/phospho-acceptor domain-containing protein [Opitutus sp.]